MKCDVVGRLKGGMLKNITITDHNDNEDGIDENEKICEFAVLVVRLAMHIIRRQLIKQLSIL